WADDTSGNSEESAPETFVLPPNWDINMDGECYIEDLGAIVSIYGTTGPDYPDPSSFGWIREDVNNDGEIYIEDLGAIVSIYGKTWP
ncbi:unnamed protein product, partial [marine sediment metagenome]